MFVKHYHTTMVLTQTQEFLPVQTALPIFVLYLAPIIFYHSLWQTSLIHGAVSKCHGISWENKVFCVLNQLPDNPILHTENILQKEKRKKNISLFSESVEFDVAWWHQGSKVTPDLCLVCHLLPSLSVRYPMLRDGNKRDTPK